MLTTENGVHPSAYTLQSNFCSPHLQHTFVSMQQTDHLPTPPFVNKINMAFRRHRTRRLSIRYRVYL